MVSAFLLPFTFLLLTFSLPLLSLISKKLENFATNSGFTVFQQ